MGTSFCTRRYYASSRSPHRLGADKLLLKGFRGSEGISRLFRFELDLLSEDQNIDYTQIIGKSVTISLKQADGTPRYFNGVISRFGQGGRGQYLHLLPCGNGPLALVPDTHCRLPHLSEHDHPRYHQAGFTRSGLQRLCRLHEGHLPAAGLLRPIPRNGFQLCLPAHGRVRHLLLLFSMQTGSTL